MSTRHSINYTCKKGPFPPSWSAPIINVFCYPHIICNNATRKNLLSAHHKHTVSTHASFWCELRCPTVERVLREQGHFKHIYVYIITSIIPYGSNNYTLCILYTVRWMRAATTLLGIALLFIYECTHTHTSRFSRSYINQKTSHIYIFMRMEWIRSESWRSMKCWEPFSRPERNQGSDANEELFGV